MKAIGNRTGFELHLPFQEKSQTGFSTYYPHYAFHREVINAMLEAEKHKAEAIMNYQRRSFAH